MTRVFFYDLDFVSFNLDYLVNKSSSWSVSHEVAENRVLRKSKGTPQGHRDVAPMQIKEDYLKLKLNLYVTVLTPTLPYGTYEVDI